MLGLSPWRSLWRSRSIVGRKRSFGQEILSRYGGETATVNPLRCRYQGGNRLRPGQGGGVSRAISASHSDTETGLCPVTHFATSHPQRVYYLVVSRQVGCD